MFPSVFKLRLGCLCSSFKEVALYALWAWKDKVHSQMGLFLILVSSLGSRIFLFYIGSILRYFNLWRCKISIFEIRSSILHLFLSLSETARRLCTCFSMNSAALVEVVNHSSTRRVDHFKKSLLLFLLCSSFSDFSCFTVVNSVLVVLHSYLISPIY